MKAYLRLTRTKGGPGSGHDGHAGRQGKRGGSLPGTGGGAGGLGELTRLYEKSGGKDEFGDPVINPEELLKADKVLNGIMEDDRKRNLAIAVAADGEVANLENLDELNGVDLVGAMCGVDPDMGGIYSDTPIGRSMNERFLSLWEDYNKAAGEPGHWQESSKMTPEREAWERKYYGKVVGGHEAGLKYAVGELNRYVESVR